MAFQNLSEAAFFDWILKCPFSVDVVYKNKINPRHNRMIYCLSDRSGSAAPYGADYSGEHGHALGVDRP